MATGQQASVDAFILFNEHEERVPLIVEHLEASGVKTYYWRRDIDVGEDFVEREHEVIQAARTVVIFLGSRGWGPTQTKLAKAAQDSKQRILPVLIGDPGPDVLRQGGIFDRLRYVDLRTDNDKEFELLVRSIKTGQPPTEDDQLRDASQFDGFVQSIVDGDETDRLATLQQMSGLPIPDRRELGARLRLEIQTKYGLESEATFSASPRPPKRIASIRSWLFSCLITADCESADSQSLILRYLSVSEEPDASVRYWILSQLYVVRASYLKVAANLAREDDAKEINLMARAILSPDDQKFLSECRTSLMDSNFEIAWPVLRLLRAIPIPSLAADVCIQLWRTEADTPLTYDSLSALCSPRMAESAAPVLMENPGIEPTVKRVIEVAGSADKVAANRFVWFLDAFPIQAVGSILEAARSVPMLRIGAERLLDSLVRISADRIENISISGYANDRNDVKNDYLDIREDVQTLAAVMLARDVNPPLAIGLFGDWGTGKSYFMDSLRAATEKLAGMGEVNICSSIVSISFNAWHYADTNLWASLVNFIMERLSAQISPQPSVQEEEDSFIGQLASAKAMVEAAQAEKRTTEALISARAADLEKAKLERQKKELTLRDLRAKDFKELLEKDPALKNRLSDALRQMGISELVESESQLSSLAVETASLVSRASALAASIASSGSIWLVLALLALVLFGIPWIAGVIRSHVANGAFVGVGMVITQLASTVIVAARIARTAVSKVRASVATISHAKNRIDEILTKKRTQQSEQELDLQTEIAALRAKEAESSSGLKAATARVAELEERIAATRRGRSLAEFLFERTKSDDYRKYLGLISIIRQDFDTLAERLKVPIKVSGSTKSVDRIVLYIDDLDRCPEEKVIEVLQAVHLLLAYPIFVVVVGVDPRWLTHSLKHSYRALRRNMPLSDSDELIQATPQNYLEKIFQIPFSLRPMSSSGYSRLIQSLFTPEVSVESSLDPLADRASAPRETQARVSRTLKGPDNAKTVRDEGDGIDPIASQRQWAQGPLSDELNEENLTVVDREALKIRPWEAAFATKLFRLIPTPRSAKRFSNIYRLLKAPIRKNRLAAFEGTEALLGDFQVPMVLLAVVIGSPETARILFSDLVTARQTRDIEERLRNPSSGDNHNPAVTALQKNLRPIVSERTFPLTPALYQFWIPRVARFSFELVEFLVPSLDLIPEDSIQL